MPSPRRLLSFRLLAAALLATAAAALTATGAAYATPGPIAAYGFDDGSGTVLSDASGNGRSGTIVGGATWTGAGKFGSALSFNGSSGRVDLPAIGTFYKTGFTLEGWVKKTTNNVDVGILGSWANADGGGPMIWVDHIQGHYYGTLAAGMSNYLDSTRSPTPGTWQFVTSTYDGTTAKFYVDGTLVASRSFTGNVGDSNEWHIGAYGPGPGGYFDGLIDEVRIYDRALSAAEVTTDMNTRVLNDTTAPTAPGSFAKTGGGVSSIATSWSPSTDAVGVAGYRLFRGGSQVATTTSLTYTFTGLTCGTGYNLAVAAFDSAGNVSAQTPLTASTSACDTTNPTVVITAPADGASVGGTTAVNATASDNDEVAGVQFKLDGANLGSEDTSAPYSYSWDTTSAGPGAHTLNAVARDASGNTKTSGDVDVTVQPAPAGSGPVASYSFNDGAGTLAGDASGNGNQGTVVSGTWTASGKNGGALSFNGSTSRVDLPALGRFYKTGFTLSAWVKKASNAVDDAILGSWDSSAVQDGGPMIWVDHIQGHYYGTLNTGMSNYLDSTRSPTPGTWQYVTSTYDGTTARFYVDGALVASKAYSGTIGDTNQWRIGAYGVNPGGFFDGVIDDVRIYSRALNLSQVQSDMTTPVASNVAVIKTTPESSATDVDAAPSISAAFNTAMASGSITGTTFTLKTTSGGVSVPATVSYDATSGTASLVPTAALAYGTSYTATVKGGAGGVTSAGGGTLPSDRTWTFTTMAKPPVLLVTASNKPYSKYVAEILKTEGLADYSTLDLSLMSSTVLSGFDQVVLGDVTLTGAQVTTLTTWVNAGGKLLALHPDPQLASLLGITSQGTTLTNAYMKVDTTAGTAGAGIVSDSIQFHGTADRYTLNGATAVASLWSNATTATSSPAVTLRSVGASGGQAAAFTFDLAKSVILTRQGNPAWAGQERDGTNPIRPDDLFFGAKVGDVQADWVDLNKVSIPQADEQQRLLANVLNRMSQNRKPLPRFWYLPRSLKAAVVMTGDDHAVGGTAGRFDQYLAASPAGCSVEDWECVRGTSYIYPGSPLTDAQAKAYENQGFEIGLHIAPAGANQLSCANWVPNALGGIFDTQLAAWRHEYPSLDNPDTHRMHCVAWADWATQPKVELAHGIRMDTNYYYYPSSWMGTKPGFMTGSGMPMRFADTDGSLIDVYQANTNITDESGQAEPSTINALLDNATNAKGFYGAFVANIHTDNAASTDSNAIVASAQSRGVPIVSAKQLLEFTNGRDASAFRSVAWSGNNLTFKISADSRANDLTAMLPISSNAKTLQSITLSGGVNVPFTTQTIKGVDYAFFTAASGNYTAAYS